ncbi:MAG: ROK family protein [Sphingobacteriales bacterium]|nr:MAG: ROK family protein [Sphingobacteriales bacterium]
MLSVDIGGSHIKATILDPEGNTLQDYTKIKTPDPASPASVIAAIQELISDFKSFSCVSVGFPGYIRNGVVWTAPNLGTELWAGFDLRKKIEKALGFPTRAVNDADMQGLGVVKGEGLELLITLGTGMGVALLLDGQLLPHLEISHHPIKGGKDYDQFIGDKALNKIGAEAWNKRMEKVLDVLKTVVNYDTLYIGGGNASVLSMKLPKNIKRVTNREGIKGGARLWTLNPKK